MRLIAWCYFSRELFNTGRLAFQILYLFYNTPKIKMHMETEVMEKQAKAAYKRPQFKEKYDNFIGGKFVPR
jgi:hypothetical protein